MSRQKLVCVFLGSAFLFLLIGILAGGSVLADDPGEDPESGEAGSLNTGKICDVNFPPKYYCTWVRYIAAGPNHWELRKRMYRGAIDGGAVAWQLWYAKDWWWDGNQWLWLVTWPSSSWFTNIPLTGKKNSGNIVTVPFDTTVTMRVRFQQCNSSGTCWFWCSNITQHNLSLGTHQQQGGGICAGDGPNASVAPN